jgi:hypothetical protein
MLSTQPVLNPGLYSKTKQMDCGHKTDPGRQKVLVLTTPVKLIALGQNQDCIFKTAHGWPSGARSWHGSLMAYKACASNTNSTCPQKHMPAPTLTATNLTGGPLYVIACNPDNHVFDLNFR